MKIKMKTLMCGPAGTRQPESVHDVPKAEADALIAGNYAEKYVDPEVVKAEAAAKAKAAKAKADKAKADKAKADADAKIKADADAKIKADADAKANGEFTLDYGKHEGVPFSEIPDDYLKYLVRLGKTDQIKAAAAAELANR